MTTIEAIIILALALVIFMLCMVLAGINRLGERIRRH